MVKEAYCSFEVARLLKEKGFNCPCHATYDTAVTGGKPQFSEYEVLSFFPNGMKNSDDKYSMVISTPTHQMAMAWLREKHRLYIGINIEVGDIQMLPSYDFEETLLGYSYAIYNEETLIWVFKDKTPRSYEKAVEAAIKYCLENLI